LQRLQNKVPRSKVPHRSSFCKRLSIFRVRIYDHITKLCRQQAEVVQNLENEDIRISGQGEARHRKYKRLKFEGGQAYGRSSDQVAVVA
jgi:hypothetical protein